MQISKQLTVPEITKDSPEIIVPIRGYEGIYEVSSFGYVRSIDRTIKFIDRYKNKGRRKVLGRVIAGGISGSGYFHLTLHANKTKSLRTIHSIVADHFCNKQYNSECVNHKDGNKTNNHAYNLEWTTNRENCIHANKIGLNDEGHNQKPVTIEKGSFKCKFKSQIAAARFLKSNRSTIWKARRYGYPHKGFLIY